MSAPKLQASQLAKMFEKPQDNTQDKKIIEELIKRLNDRILKDPQTCKKAALILENWLQQKPKK
jgi:hypothetical protein